jgi:hydrogenase maturation protein HypF
MGRLFDAVSSLLGLRHRVSFEAQAVIELEAAAERALAGGIGAETFPRFCVHNGGIMDPAPVLRWLADGVLEQRPVPELALAFHHAVADVVLHACLLAGTPRNITLVGLTGGVFQNTVLLRACRDRLRWAGFEVISHHVVPPNDGGIALGQAAVAAFALTSANTRPDRES